MPRTHDGSSTPQASPAVFGWAFPCRLLLILLVSSVSGPLAAQITSALAPTGQGSEAEALVDAGHFKRARAILEPLVKAQPQEARRCFLLAEVKASFKDFQGALPLAQRAVDIDGKSSDYHLELGKILGQIASQASFISAGPLAIRFRRQVEIALQLDPGNLDALDAMMQFKFQAPGIMGGSKDEARALADKIIRIDPTEGCLDHAELAEMENDAAQAEADLGKAVQANPHNYAAQRALARFYSRPPHARYDEAITHARSATGLDPQRIAAYWILARVFTLQENWGELDKTLAAAEKNVPDDLRPFYEAAQALLEIGRDLPKAEAYARKYLSQEPEGEEPGNADAHKLLGRILEKQGRRAEARSER